MFDILDGKIKPIQTMLTSPISQLAQEVAQQV
jgi:hypothetical protein